MEQPVSHLDQYDESHRNAVLDALYRNRTPGWSFTGHLLGISFDRVSLLNSTLRCESAEHICTSDGFVDFGAVAVLGDLALGVCCRKAAGNAVRLATVSLSITMHGALGAGDLTARSQLCSYDSKTRMSTALARIFSGSSLLCTVSGTFVALPASDAAASYEPRFRIAKHIEIPALEPDLLSDQEAAVFARVSGETLPVGRSFLSRFWGFDVRKSWAGGSGRLTVGPHLGNRVGHVQGGILCAFAAEVAYTARRNTFQLASMHATFHRPGESGALHGNALRVHKGRTTEVINTAVTDRTGTTVLFAQSTFCRS